MSETAALVAAALIGVVILFQAALVAGAPWGAAAWGGQRAGTLPATLRVASVIAIGILVLLAWIVLAAAGLVPSPIPGEWLSPASWIGTGYFVLGGIVNLISRSKVERVWSPVALATAVCYGLVSAS